MGLLLVPITLRAQDPYFSQYYAAPLFLNPALVGIEQDTYLGVNYRSQWSSLDFPFNTTQFSFIQPLYKKGAKKNHIGGFGATFFNDVSGPQGNFKTQGISAAAAYNLHLLPDGDAMISFGIQGGFIRKQIDLSSLQWGSQYDPFLGFDQNLPSGAGFLEDQTFYPVINAGIFYYFNPNKKYHFIKYSFYGGFSASYLNQPNESLIQDANSVLPILLKLHGGIEFRLTRDLHFSPNFLIMEQNKNRFYNVGGYFTYTYRKGSAYNPRTKSLDLHFGTWYHWGDAFTITLGTSFQKLTFGFSYDVNVSSLRFNTAGRGAYEISLAYRISHQQGLRRFSTPLF